MLATYIRGHNKTEEQVPLREPDLMIVMTGGKIAYTRPDGVKIIPLACLKDVKSWRDDMKWRLSTDIYNCTAPPQAVRKGLFRRPGVVLVDGSKWCERPMEAFQN